MTDTTAPTLRELLSKHQVTNQDIDSIEAQLLEPLRAEIARLQETMDKTLSGEWIPGVLAMQMSDKDAQIAQLRAKTSIEGPRFKRENVLNVLIACKVDDNNQAIVQNINLGKFLDIVEAPLHVEIAGLQEAITDKMVAIATY